MNFLGQKLKHYLIKIKVISKFEILDILIHQNNQLEELITINELRILKYNDKLVKLGFAAYLIVNQF